MTISPRPLTYDEQKAAEAAFLGLPFNADWTEAGQAVYVGIRAAIVARTTAPHFPDHAVELEISAA
jgi:hypothetical protein